MFVKLKTFIFFSLIFSFFNSFSFNIPDDLLEGCFPAPIEAADRAVKKIKQLPSDVYDAACRNPKATAVIVGVAAATAAAVSNERNLLKIEGAGPGDRPGLLAVFRSSGPRAVFSGALVGSGVGVLAKNGQLAVEVRETDRLSRLQAGVVGGLEAGAEEVRDGVGRVGEHADELHGRAGRVAVGAEGLRDGVDRARAAGLEEGTALQNTERTLAGYQARVVDGRALTQAEIKELIRIGGATAELNAAAGGVAAENADLLAGVLGDVRITDSSNPQTGRK